jgi:hypothetical protein
MYTLLTSFENYKGTLLQWPRWIRMMAARREGREEREEKEGRQGRGGKKEKGKMVLYLHGIKQKSGRGKRANAENVGGRRRHARQEIATGCGGHAF